MKKILALFAWLIVFALVWAAGHDILQGEPDAWLEWAIVLVGLWLAISALVYRIKKLKIGGQA
jgi:hypothetical protein